MKDMQARQLAKHTKERAELSRYLTAPKLNREKAEVQSMEARLKDKHNKENAELAKLCKEKKQ